MANRTSSALMLAVKQDQFGGPNTLKVAEHALPQPLSGQLRIKVAYAGLNRPDLLQRQGLYPAPKGQSQLLGLEASGIVDAIGPGLDKQWLGQKVCALCNGGAYAQYVCVAATQVLLVPAAMSMAQAAGLPEGLFTAWLNLIQMAQLQAGEIALIHGGSGGLGHIAIQLSCWRGAQVVSSAGEERKQAFCKRLGARWVMDYRSQDLYEFVTESVPGKRLDVVLDCIGASYVQQHIDLANDRARIVQVAFQHGAKCELNLLRLMLKRIQLTGSTLRIRSDVEKAEICKQIQTQLWPSVEQWIKVHVDAVYELADVAAAHAAFERAEHKGKLLLALPA